MVERKRSDINDKIDYLIQHVEQIENIKTNDYIILCNSIQTIYNINNSCEELNQRRYILYEQRPSITNDFLDRIKKYIKVVDNMFELIMILSILVLSTIITTIFQEETIENGYFNDILYSMIVLIIILIVCFRYLYYDITYSITYDAKYML